MDANSSAYTQVSSPSKMDMEQVRMDTRRDSAVGIASANAVAIDAPSLSSHTSKPPGTQHELEPDSSAQVEKPTEVGKTKKKKKKKGKAATATGTLSPIEPVENAGDTSPDSGGADQYHLPDGDDLEWLESAVVKGDTKPMGKKAKAKKRSSKRHDARKVVEIKDGDGISAMDDENDQESEGKADNTQERDTTGPQNNTDMEWSKGAPTNNLAFIEDDSFMNGGASNWADDMAELDPQPWGEMGSCGQDSSAADQGSPITPPSSTSSSIVSSSTLVSWTSLPDDAQESQPTTLPTTLPQDSRLYEHQDRRPPRQDYRGQPRPSRPPRSDRPPRSNLKDPQTQRPHSHSAQRLESFERHKFMRPPPGRQHGYENWVHSAADSRDHHAGSLNYSSQRHSRSHPLLLRPDVHFVGAHVLPHHHLSGHLGHGHPGQGHLGRGHPGYLGNSNPHITTGHDQFFHTRLSRPKPGYGMLTTDAKGPASRQDNYWRRQQQSQKFQQQQSPQKSQQQYRDYQEEERQQKQHVDAISCPPTRHAIPEESLDSSTNGTSITRSEHTDTASSEHIDMDHMPELAFGTETPPRPRAVMGLAMIGRQLAPWEDRDKVIEILNRRWEDALRLVDLDGNTTASAIFYTSDM